MINVFKIFLTVLLTILFSLPLTADAKSQSLQIDGDHGKLSAVIQTPDDKKSYPLVMILHGFTGNKNEPLLTALADDLEKAGIASIRFDFNGHGESDGDFSDMTVLNEIEDAKKVYNYVSKLPNVTSISIAGHSQGGVVTSMLAGELGTKKVKCIALMAPAAVLRDDAIRGQLFDFKYDSMNPPQYVEIFGGLKLGRNYILTAQTLPIYETAEKYQGPALMIHGTGDVVVPYTYSLHYQHIYPQSQLELLPGFDHSFTQDVAKTAKIAADYLVMRNA
ncbi:MAG: alpha/beta fold hydrolase [Selenomonadaceae bacterium]|nr:alpha/beta fold hydrolase [Selenomonadaceae bacterium]